MQATNREYVVLSLEEWCFSCVMLGVPFSFFVLKLILKHLSVRFSGSTMSFNDPPGTSSFFSKHDLILFGGDTKSVPNRHAVKVVLCLGAAASEHPKAT